MADYDPRTATGIPTEPVGSLPRPSELQQAYGQYDAGEITHDQLEAEQDKAVRDSIERGEAFGFLGPNGAGKTSTMRMVFACTMRPTLLRIPLTR